MSLINDALIDLEQRRNDCSDIELGYGTHKASETWNSIGLSSKAILTVLFLFFAGFLLFYFGKENPQDTDVSVEKPEIEINQRIYHRDQRVVEQATIALENLQLSFPRDISHELSFEFKIAEIEINKDEVEVKDNINSLTVVNEYKQEKQNLPNEDEVKSNKATEAKTTSDMVLAIEKSGGQEQRDRIAEVEQLLSQNKKHEAIKLMQARVDSADSIFWVDRLVKYYLAEKQYLKAKYLIEDKGDPQGRHSYAYVQSLRATEGDTATTKFILSLESPDEKSLATLAGLLQKQERYQESSDVYQNLLRKNDRNGVYWLGLAIALDKLNDSLTAISAYKNALQFAQHKAPVVDFAHARIKSLALRNGALESQQW